MKRIVASICLSYFLMGCKPLKIVSHIESETNIYCVYKITAVSNTGAMHALKNGDVICLYCANADDCILYTKAWIKLYVLTGDPKKGLFISKDTGISCMLESENPAATCATCPGANKFELL